MRFLNGVVIGILLTVGVAYMHDRSVATGADGTRHDLVNWEEFGRSVGIASDWLEGAFARLNEQFHRPR